MLFSWCYTMRLVHGCTVVQDIIFKPLSLECSLHPGRHVCILYKVLIVRPNQNAYGFLSRIHCAAAMICLFLNRSPGPYPFNVVYP
jgi:hypothetical protein